LVGGLVVVQPAIAHAAPQPTPAATQAPPADKAAVLLLDEAKNAYADLDVEQANARIDELMALKAAGPELRAQALLLRATIAIGSGDTEVGEQALRQALHEQPTLALPAGVSPKIRAVFDRIVAERDAAERTIREAQRQRIAAALSFLEQLPTKHTGGQPLAFRTALSGPTDAIDAVEVHYRKQGAARFAVLPLVKDDKGAWAGVLPGAWTASDADYTLEFFVVARDSEGPLLESGTAEAPLRAEVVAGQEVVSFVAPSWSVWTAGVAGGVGLLTAGGLLAGGLLLNEEHNQLVSKARTEPVPAADLQHLASQADGLLIGSAIAAGMGVVSALTAALLWPWLEEPAP
jgi:hypothetical protein